jgi:hypothetical protein
LFLRILVLVLIAAACAGCAGGSGPGLVAGYAAPNVQAAPAVKPWDATAGSQVEMDQIGRKTLAAKVLAAIALERVTGRKPDPARFADLI